jgi:death-on-curing protein
VRYLTLAEALLVAEAVTGIDALTLRRASRVELLDSALHAPQAGFGEEDLYPSFEEKAAVLCSRIARNHPLPDGNKRLAWQCLTLFCALNRRELQVPTDDAVTTVLTVAAGDLDEKGLTSWLRDRVIRQD